MNSIQSLKYLQPTIKTLLSSQVFDESDFEGCTSAEISYIEETLFAYPGDIPAAYLEFLELMGRNSGGFMRRASANFPSVLGLPSALITLLPDTVLFSFERWQEGVYFACHEGYMFWFFLPDNDDPEVYLFTEMTSVKSTNLKLSEFLAFMCSEGIYDQKVSKHFKENR